MTTDTLEKQKVVPKSLCTGWSHPAVQRLRHALERLSPSDGLLQRDLEEVLLRGVWMTDFLPVPFTNDSAEGVRLQAVLERAKVRHPNRRAVQEFVFKFWNPDVLDELALMSGDGLDFETAFAQSLTPTHANVKTWPNGW